MLKETPVGLFDDILKGLPVNPLLREKVADAEARYAAAQTENAGLKDDLREAKAQIAKLKNQVEEFSHSKDLDKLETLLLGLLADPTIEHDAEALARGLNEHPTRIKYHLERLVSEGLIIQSEFFIGGSPVPYYLTQQGREYLVKNDLI